MPNAESWPSPILSVCHAICPPSIGPADAGVLTLQPKKTFTLVGVFRRIGFKLGRWWDVGWWALELQRPEAPGEPSGPVRLADL